MEIAAAFFQASRSGDMGALEAMLAEDVAVYSDGGGKRPAAYRPFTGRKDALAVLAALARLLARAPGTLVGYRMINGLPGFLTREADGMLQTTALLVENDRVAGIYVIPPFKQPLGALDLLA